MQVRDTGQFHVLNYFINITLYDTAFPLFTQCFLYSAFLFVHRVVRISSVIPPIRVSLVIIEWIS